MSKPVIGWGVGAIHHKTEEKATHEVLRLYVDYKDTVRTVVKSETHCVEFTMSIEHAQNIGLINLDALEPFINKM